MSRILSQIKRSRALMLERPKFEDDNNTVEYQSLRLLEMEAANSKLEKQVDQNKKELIDVNETNWKYISIIAHDLRSPFSSIIGSLELLKEKLEVHHMPDVDKYIDMASDSATCTLELLDNLLAWTIAQHKSKCVNPEGVNLHGVVTSEMKNAQYAANSKSILLLLDIPVEICVMADIQMVKTILRNLLGNAIKYTNSNGEITISASYKNEFVEVKVKDDGIGFSRELQKDLFSIKKAFSSTPGTNNELGTGLGLVLCQEFVELQGGSIRIESNVDTGSEIIFTLLRYFKM